VAPGHERCNAGEGPRGLDRLEARLPLRQRDLDEPGRVAVGQGPEQQAVDDREERAVGADTQAERQHDHRGKGRLRPQNAGAVPKRVEECVHDRAALLFGRTWGKPGC
jgi:hypothetical protein